MGALLVRLYAILCSLAIANSQVGESYILWDVRMHTSGILVYTQSHVCTVIYACTYVYVYYVGMYVCTHACPLFLYT